MKIIKTIFVFTVLNFIALYGFSQAQKFRNIEGVDYNFWVNLPEAYQDSTLELPLVLFLHGKSLSGNNLDQVKRYGILRESTDKRKLDAVVVAPQCPRGQSWNADKVLGLVNYIQENYRTDTNRLYVAGMSMGGYGTLRFTGKYPEKVAAAVALCGGGNVADACRLSEVPLWIIHGTSDRAVPVRESEKIVDAIHDCTDSSLLKFDYLDGVGHSALARFFSMDELYDWMFLYSKSDTLSQLVDSLEIDYTRFGARKNTRTYVSSTGSEKSETPSSKTHIVRSGDSLWKISRRYGTSVATLCKLNGLTESSVLQIGQKIKLP
ncbi:MAG: LysM peptidoglycan-binding domain-containing protein [Bacteroidales bacterium]